MYWVALCEEVAKHYEERRARRLLDPETHFMQILRRPSLLTTSKLKLLSPNIQLQYKEGKYHMLKCYTIL
jgi:hypothetical protein